MISISDSFINSLTFSSLISDSSVDDNIWPNKVSASLNAPCASLAMSSNILSSILTFSFLTIYFKASIISFFEGFLNVSIWHL